MSGGAEASSHWSCCLIYRGEVFKTPCQTMAGRDIENYDVSFLSPELYRELKEILSSPLVFAEPSQSTDQPLTQPLPDIFHDQPPPPKEKPLDLSIRSEETGESTSQSLFSTTLPQLPPIDSDLEEDYEEASGEDVSSDAKASKGCPVLWQFLLSCLSKEELNPSVITWVSKEEGVFRLTNPSKMAQLWGEVKHKPGMSEDNLKRSLRYYYGKNILTKVQGHRDVYKFYSGLL